MKKTIYYLLLFLSGMITSCVPALAQSNTETRAAAITQWSNQRVPGVAGVTTYNNSLLFIPTAKTNTIVSTDTVIILSNLVEKKIAATTLVSSAAAADTGIVGGNGITITRSAATNTITASTASVVAGSNITVNGSTAGSVTTYTVLAGSTPAWSLTGNTGTVDGTNFLGTLDNVPINFKINNIKAGRLGDGNDNYWLGLYSGTSLSSGFNNTGIGRQVFYSLSSGSDNVAVGYLAGVTCTTCLKNVFVGSGSGQSMTGASTDDNFIGYRSGYQNTTGSYNNIVGMSGFLNNTSGGFSTGMGQAVMEMHLDGDYQTAFGYHAGFSDVHGNNNLFLGSNAGYYGNHVGRIFIDTYLRADSTGQENNSPIVCSVSPTDSSIQIIRLNGTVKVQESIVDLHKTINTTAGDAVTINAMSGRFRKDVTGTTFTLTNSYITANSIIHLDFASDVSVTGNQLSVVAGTGSAVITFWTVGVGAGAPSSNQDVNFFIIN